MIKKITALSNAPVASSRTDALVFAFRDALEALNGSPETETAFFCPEASYTPAGRQAEAILSSSENFSQNLLGACRRLAAHYEAVSDRVIRSANASDVFFLGDVAGISAVEWIPALACTQRAIPWVYTDWPRTFPACDPFWEEHRHGSFTRRLIASACVKLAYKNNPAHRDRLSPVSTAIFASVPMAERNRQSFPHLREMHIFPLPLDTEVFKFKPQNNQRSRAWGWIGDWDADLEDASIALKIFAFEALQNPECRFYMAADIRSPAGQKVLASVRGHPALAPRVTFLTPPKDKFELAAMLRDFGVIIVPRSRTGGDYPQLIAYAIACGCFPLCGADAETEALLADYPDMLFPAGTPSTAFLRCEKLKVYDWNTRTEMLAALAQRIVAASSCEVVARRLLEIL